MKRRIALFANGWSKEYLQEVTDNMLEFAKDNNIDLFAFVNYSTYEDPIQVKLGESNIFRLPDLNDFDGAVLLANSFNYDEEVKYLRNEIIETGIAAVSLEYELDGIVSVVTDNYSGMYELASHIINEHRARNILFISGHIGHPDNTARQKAVADAMRDAGLVLDDSNTVFGDWSCKTSVVVFKEWVEKNGMPDAVLCANDEMACAVFDYIEKRGYNIPQDIIVTGYDCIKRGQLYLPSISSVKHEWALMGKKAMQLIVDMLDGKEVDKKIVLNSVFVRGGSCGCAQGEEYYKKLRRDNLLRKVDWISSDSHFRHMNSSMRNPDNATGLSMALSGFFNIQHDMEGDRFMLCLEPEFFKLAENDSNLKDCGYSDMLEVTCCLDNNIKHDFTRMDKNKAVLYASEKYDDTGIYLYVPVYNDSGKTYGYAMLSRNMRIIDDNMLYVWTRHMNQSIEQVRRNIKISELTDRLKHISVTDALTGIYNRAGCEQIIYPMLQSNNADGKMCAIMLIDVDGLKIINDIYGHANGDLAICSVSDVLKLSFPDDWYISRIGGDEFVAAGPCITEEYVVSMVEGIEKKLVQKAERDSIPFKLSASVGYAVILPDEEFNVERSLKKADEYMYKMKRDHHMYSR